MRWGICAAPEINFDAAGWDYLEARVAADLVPEGSDEEFETRLAALRSSPLQAEVANLFLPGHLPCVGPDVDSDRLQRYASAAFCRAKIAGIRVIVFGSGRSRQIPDGWPETKAFAQMVGLLEAIAPMAEDHGVTLVIEPLNRGECNFIHSPSDGARLVHAVNHPAFRLLVDVFHMLRNGEGPEEIERNAGLIAHVHVAEKETRSAPGVAGDDFRPYFAPLKRNGYDSRISIECQWTDASTEAPRALSVLQSQWADC